MARADDSPRGSGSSGSESESESEGRERGSAGRGRTRMRSPSPAERARGDADGGGSPHDGRRKLEREDGGRAARNGADADEEDGGARTRARGDDRSAEADPAPSTRRERSRPAPEDPTAVALERATGGEAKAGGKQGGVYIPPYKLAQMMKDVTDRTSEQYQRMSWEALKKSINGLINKVNTFNLKSIVLELFGENIVRGRALLVRSLIKSQIASPGFTHVYAALIAVVNTKMPEIGELLLKRIVSQFRRAFKRNDKGLCLTLGRFIAHLVNQQVSHELLALQILAVLLEAPTDQSVEVACALTTEVGFTLSEISPEGLNGVFERLRSILHEGQIDKRVQYTIEVLFAKRKAKFAEHPGIVPGLDVVEPDDQITHEVGRRPCCERAPPVSRARSAHMAFMVWLSVPGFSV